MHSKQMNVVLLNILVNVWARAVEMESPEAKPAGYADDTGATETGLQPLLTNIEKLGVVSTVRTAGGRRLRTRVRARATLPAHQPTILSHPTPIRVHHPIAASLIYTCPSCSTGHPGTSLRWRATTDVACSRRDYDPSSMASDFNFTNSD